MSGERWVNARIELVVVLDKVDPDAPDSEKQEALVDAMEFVLERLEPEAQDIATSGRWEVVSDDG